VAQQGQKSYEGKEACIKTIEGVIILARQEKCMKLFAQIVGRKQKFPSNQMVPDLSIAENVFRNINQRDFSKKL
jgi:hypothetical protein